MCVSVPEPNELVMALIDLTIKKPALKRTEVIDPAEASETTSTGESADVRSSSSGRLRRSAGTIGILAIGLVSFVTLKRIRSRRKHREPVEDSEE